MSKRAPLPPVNRGAIANAFEHAGHLIVDAECSLRVGWERDALERCSALLAGAKAILDMERAKLLPAETSNDEGRHHE